MCLTHKDVMPIMSSSRVVLSNPDTGVQGYAITSDKYEVRKDAQN